MQSFQTLDDVMGRNTSVLTVSNHTLALLLSPGISKTVTVPPDARVALFSATGNFWLSADGAPAVPAADILDGTAPELNPAGRAVKSGQTLGFVAPAACTICLSFYG
jgi:hypothetical protein